MKFTIFSKPRSRVGHRVQWEYPKWHSLLICFLVLVMTLNPLATLAMVENLSAVPGLNADRTRAEVMRDAAARLQEARAANAANVAGLNRVSTRATAARTVALASPAASGAAAAYPLNHLFAADPAEVGTPPANHDFSQAGGAVGTPPTNHDFSAIAGGVGTPPTNADFENGDLSGWTTSGTITLQNDADHGYWAEVGRSGTLISDAFVVDSAAQQLLVDMGYLHSRYGAYVQVHALSGPTFSTQTLLKTLYCNNCNWQTEALSVGAFSGQTIKLRFKRLLGTAGVDDIRMVSALPGYNTTGTVERTEEANGNVYAKVSQSGATITSSPLLVDATAQQVRVDITGDSNYGDQYRVEVLSGADFATATTLSYGVIDDSWQTIQADVKPWQDQEIKLKVSRLFGSIGVDNIGIQQVVAPHWDFSGDSQLVSDGNGGYGLRTDSDLTSAPFDIAESVQQVTIDYCAPGDASISNYFQLKAYGANGEANFVGTTYYALRGECHTAKLGVGTYAGQQIQLGLVNVHGDIVINSMGMGELVTEGWATTSDDPIQGGEDAHGSYITGYESNGATFLRSGDISPGIIDSAGFDQRYYSFAYDIGYATASLTRVTWTNTDGDSWVVYTDASNTPTGHKIGYFWLADFMGERGHFDVKVTGGGKVYSIGSNIARQQLAEPFSQKVGLQIDTSTGAFGYQAEDRRVDGLTPLVFTRYYNGHDNTLGSLGYGWSHSYDARLVFTAEGHAGVLFGTGQELFFEWKSTTQTFRPVDVRIYDELIKEGDGTYTFTTKANQRYFFDAAGALTSVQDENDNSVSLAHNGAGQLSSVTAAGGSALTLTYNGDGRLSGVTDPAGATIDYSYNGAGDLTSVSRPDAGTESYQYDLHRLTQITDANGNVVVQNAFDVAHRVIEQTDALNNTITLDYGTPADGVTAVTDPEGNTAYYYFDRFHRTTDRVDPAGNVVTNIYDGNGNLTKVVDAAFGEWNFVYNSDGDLLSSQDPLGNPIQITYNPEHLPTTITDANGNTTTIGYDGNGNVTQVIDPLGNETLNVYDASGNLISTTNPLGDTTSYTYDDAGNRLTEVDALGNTWAWEYNFDGEVKLATDPLGHTVRYFYDLVGRLIAIRDHEGNEKTFVYDPAGHLLMVEDELGRRTLWDYDERGLVEKRIDTAGKETTYAYDANRNLTTMTDPLGLVTSYQYDSNNRVTQQTAPGGATTQYVYDGTGRLSTETNALGQSVGYSYDDAGNLVGLTLPTGAVYTFAYDANGNQTQITDPLNRTTSYTYDALSRVTAVTDAAGHSTTIGYDAAGRQTTATNAAGETTTTSYNALGLPVVVTDALGNTTGLAYDAAGRRTNVTNALGHSETVAYDALNRPVTMTDALGNNTTLTYDMASQLLEVAAATGAVTSYSYDARGLRTSVTDALDAVTSYSYNDGGRLTTVQNALGGTIQYGYDAAGQMNSITDPVGNVTSYGFDVMGNRTSVTDALGTVQTTAYDNQNRPVTMTDALGNGIQMSYDAAGQLTTVTLPSGEQSSYLYDSRGQLTDMIDPLGEVEQYEYDSVGRRTKTIDRRGYATTLGYDAASRPTSMTDALGHSVQMAYDAIGQLTSVTNPLGQQKTFTYDALGNLLSETDPLGRTRQIAYDQYGRPETTTDARGIAVTYAYDALNRVTSVTHPDGATNYSFDAVGRLQSAADPSGTVAFTYDAASRVSAIQSSQGTVNYGYDAVGQRTSMTLPGGRTVGYSYDAAGQLTDINDWTGGAQQIGYTADGYPSSVTRPNGVNSSFGYDAVGQLVDVTHSNGAGTLQSYSYTLDENGNRTGVTTGGTAGTGSENYTLDELNRITSVSYANGDSVTYGYDANGNRTSQNVNGISDSYQYDAAGQMLTDGNTTYSYDANGNMIGASAGATSDSYSWDWSNRMTGATVDGVVTSYDYDAFDVRVGATVDGVTNDFVWDRLADYPQLLDDGSYGYLHGLGVMAQFGNEAEAQVSAASLMESAASDSADTTEPTKDGGASTTTDLLELTESTFLPLVAGQSGAAVTGAAVQNGDDDIFLPFVSSSFAAGTGSVAGNGLAAAQVDPGAQFLLGDGLGSIRGIADSGGALVGDRSFDVFGDIVSQSGSSSSFGYTGEYHAAETGLLHLRARDLDSSSGRFLSADTVQPNAPGTQGYNLYAYTANNPTTWADPSGHSVLPNFVLSLDAAEAQGLAGLGLAIAKLFLYLACMLDAECRDTLLDYRGIVDQFGSAVQETVEWTVDNVLTAPSDWPILPEIPRPLALMLGVGIGFVPVVGDMYDAVAVVTGVDPFTGEPLSRFERGLAIGAVFLPFVTVGMIRGLTRGARVASNSPNWVLRSKPTYYVSPAGEAFPATAYRYSDSRYADGIFSTSGSPGIPNGGHYIGFESIGSASQVQDRYQISTDWSDARIRGEFNTLQLFDDASGKWKARVPNTLGDTTNVPEPFTVSYPDFGSGGAQQYLTDPDLPLTYDAIQWLRR